MIIDVAKDFSKTPFGRFPSDGDSNAQKFRVDILVPALSDPANKEIIVDFSNVALGVGSSFLEESFGGLVRKHKLDAADILNRVKIIASVTFYQEQMERFVRRADKQRMGGE